MNQIKSDKRSKAVALGVIATIALSSGSFFAGNEVKNNDNWNGLTYIQIPEDLDITAKRFIESSNADSIAIYGYDYRIPELDGILLYTKDNQGLKSKVPPNKSVPEDFYASRIDRRWSNDLRKIPSIFEGIANGKLSTEISVSIPIIQVSVPAGRVVITLPRKLTQKEKDEISDQVTSFARELQIR